MVIPSQDYSNNPSIASPLYSDYFDVTYKTQELKLIEAKILKALALWETYSVNHEIILFA
jgi:hypothetical protein